MARNLRKKPRISYYELEEPKPDEYVFCTQCRDMVYEYCSIHGPLLVVSDAIPVMSQYPPFVPKAALTLPKRFLHIAPSNIPGAGLGIFSSMALPEGVRFGPFVGEKVKDSKSSYCWQIYDGNNKPRHVIDASDANRSNWMRYVNCSRHWIEQNLIAYQYQGQLYYRTCKLIPRHTELLVYYGKEFGRVLHIDFRRYNKLPLPLLEYINGSLLLKEKSTKNISSSSRNEDVAAVKVNEDKGESFRKKKPIFKVPTKSSLGEEKVLTSISENTSLRQEFPIPAVNLSHEAAREFDNSEDFNVTNIISNYYCDHCTCKFSSKLLLSEHVAQHMISSKPTELRSVLNDSGPADSSQHTKSFTCDVCQKQFRVFKYLRKHQRVHTGEKPYTCDVCQKQFRDSKHLRIHLRKHTGEKPYTCDVCQKRFVRRDTLRNHTSIHTGEKPYTCDVCQKRFATRDNLRRHTSIHTGEKPYTCDVCQKRFATRNNLRKHTSIHTGEKPYTCDVCEKHFRHSNDLRIHLRIHTGEKPYTCDVCQKQFGRRHHLREHTSIHTVEKPYACDVCPKRFARRDTLRRHTSIHTCEKLFACDVCQKQFRDSKYLRIHLRIHTGEKPYTCDVCQKQFGRLDSLRNHTSIHTGEKPYACDVCQKRFARCDTLRRHTSIHTGEKPYACDVCQKWFATRDNLRKHTSIHTCEKLFACDVCQKQFRDSKYLRIHLRIHTGEKPYTCDVCQKRFVRRDTLRNHTSIHTGEKPYACNLCQKQFGRRDSLRLHMRVIHSSE